MHKTYLLICLLILSLGSCSIFKNKTQTTLSTSFQGVPYRISVKAAPTQIGEPHLQGFSMARHEGKWLLIGGRIEGFHGRADLRNQFLTRQSNNHIWVVDYPNGKSWKAPLPEKYKNQLMSTNAQSVQDENVLYLAGGYGVKESGGTQGNHTFPRLLAIDVPGMIQSIMRDSTNANLEQHILFTIDDPQLQVTGGELFKYGNSFFLVFGHNYEGVYAPGLNGVYTEEIRQFRIEEQDGTHRLVMEQTYQDNQTPSRYHRRDLNVVETMQNGKKGLAVYGGVFTPDDDGWLNPVFATLESNNRLSMKVDTSFEQKMSQYKCGQVLLYDNKSKTMYTTLLGGISHYMYDEQKEELVVGDNGAKLPFTPIITTMALTSNGSSHQHLQLPPEEAVLPALIGADGEFIPNKDLLLEGHIIDYSKLSKTAPTMLGYFYGGILSTAPTSGGSFPTRVNDVIYEVYFTPVMLR